MIASNSNKNCERRSIFYLTVSVKTLFKSNDRNQILLAIVTSLELVVDCVTVVGFMISLICEYVLL